MTPAQEDLPDRVRVECPICTWESNEHPVDKTMVNAVWHARSPAMTEYRRHFGAAHGVAQPTIVEIWGPNPAEPSERPATGQESDAA